MSLKGKTVIISAGNRGGGLALSTFFCNAGANVAILADKISDNQSISEPEICQNDSVHLVSINMSDHKQIYSAVKQSVDKFQGIDVVVNNFSIFNFKSLMDIKPEEYQAIMRNISATFFLSQTCIPYLKNSANPHIINISPPLIHMAPAKEACKHHLAFSISKYAMSLCTLGLAEELRPFGIAVNSLWQERPVSTKTLQDNFASAIVRGSNRAEIYAHAACLIAQRSSREFTGQYCLDEETLREAGLDPLQYAIDPQANPVKDIFLPGVDYDILKSVLA